MKRGILLLALVLMGLFAITGCSHGYYHEGGRDRHGNRYYRGDRDRYDRWNNRHYQNRPYGRSGVGVRVGIW